MDVLNNNLSLIASYKGDIKSAIEDKGVDMTSASLADYASKIGEIQTGGTFVTEVLSVSVNNTYYPSQGVDGFSQVVVDVPQSVTGYTELQLTEKHTLIDSVNNSASYVGSYAFINEKISTVNLPKCRFVNQMGFYSCASLVDVNLPVCSIIGNSAFQFCTKLTEINAPECIEISANGFTSCQSMSVVSFPLVSSVGNAAFSYCASLNDVSLPECMSLGMSAFANCDSLSELSLPLVSSIGNYAFASCRSLVKLTLCTETYKIPGYQSRMFSNATQMINAAGSGSIYVASDMYSRWIVSAGWSSLASRFVSVNQSGPVLSFSDGVVSGITRYLDATWASYLDKSKDDVVELSLSGITKMSSVFSQCQNLTRVSLPACSFLSGSAFKMCTSLSYVYIPECKKIEAYAFERCTSLNYISAPECSSIIAYAFESCYLLSSISLPLCEYIGNYAFSECSSLERVDLSVCSYIGSYAFYNCGSLSEVILGYSSICQFENNTFTNMTWSIFKIYVPSSLVDDYKTTYLDWWYSSFIFPIPE